MLGHMWLRAAFAPQSPPPYTESYLVAGARRTEVIAGRIVEFYPRSYATGDDVVANLRFALRYEPLDLGVLAAVFAAMLVSAMRTASCLNSSLCFIISSVSLNEP